MMDGLVQGKKSLCDDSDCHLSKWKNVLMSCDLMDAITCFQGGIVADLLPLLVIDYAHTPLDKNIKHGQELLAPWLLMHGHARLAKISPSTLESLLPLVGTHAISTSDFPLLEFVVGALNRTVFKQHAFIDIAAKLNNFAVLCYLDDVGHMGCTMAAIDAAASHGNLEMVQFLHTHRLEGCSHVALVRATEQGHVDVLRYLLDHRLGGNVNPWLMRCHVLFNAALKNGHLNMATFLMTLGWRGSEWSVQEAAKHDKVDVMTWLHAQPAIPRQRIGWAMNCAADLGHLDVLTYLHDQYPHEYNPTTMDMDPVAENGHLAVLQYLHRHGGRCTTNAMNLAASNGHLDIVQWLHSHRDEGCTIEAMDAAAANNHMEVVQFLVAHRSEQCSTKAMNLAAGNGHLDMLQWLHEHSRAGWTIEALDNAAKGNHMAVVQWLLANQSCSSQAEIPLQRQCSDRAPRMAAAKGHSKMAKWLLETQNVPCEAAVACGMAGTGDVDVLAWLVRTYPHVAVPELLCKASARGQVDAVKWILVNISVGCPSCAYRGTHKCYRRVRRLLQATPKGDRWCHSCKLAAW
ncbi:Aste57867_19627 [Aphanomyces stellatus]|uniref:Aste57867_19627 protein n=1 Tax=Aphanomyces stellatus TaxID=120398 RepID=A0A485LD22_9STRA|nr:hypothetical protein As57867_019562 [Aphanomyces stellatus]VFT96327.1 Aste57867_19627 [Aphanomyces stellatus]